MLKSVPGRAASLLVLAALLSGMPGGREGPAAGTRGVFALINARIYPAPGQEAIPEGVVVVRDGRIAAVGSRGAVTLPPHLPVFDCTGLVLTAGFWNSHVHFIEPQWRQAASLSADQLARQLQEMLTRYGFTTVFDVGSPWSRVETLRKRIESGEVPGPRIFSTGEILFPGGEPASSFREGRSSGVEESPGVDTPEEAVRRVRRRLDQGADGIKVYALAWWDHSLKMPPEVIQAVAVEAHLRGKPVFAHPANGYGVRVALEGGADILAHTAPPAGPWDEAMVARLRQADMALIPTLSLWRAELIRTGVPASVAQKFQDAAVEQLRAYFRAGGQILFGTDIDYLTEFDPTEEYQQMARAGMSFTDILASLTTAPAQRFGLSSSSGRVAPGMAADLVLLAADPADDVRAFSRVSATFRNGRPIYLSRPERWSALSRR